MLRSALSFIGHRLSAQDGFIGHCSDFLFDDEAWVARYLVADTDEWFSSRRVLISPYALTDPDLGKASTEIPVNLTKQQIEDAPGLDTDAPVSRRHEAEMAKFYQQPFYWEGRMLWGSTLFPTFKDPPTPEELAQHIENLDEIDASHLRSVHDVIDYRIAASDGEIGHVEDFIFENATWAIRYLVVDTRNWLPGRKVLISPEWTRDIDWYEARVAVDMTRDEIKDSPRYDPLKPVNRDYENEMYDYYGRKVYY
ncbi:MAG: PRC-barrel domain-containing protein [Akkermansiaceae bacterium]|nr:PRC-barrel domain-containing protein [Akkermansiaceae bacterium]NNM28562.1 PRC-barrel domain-containing protein [Akkermansiaceae bacterium]